MNLNHKPGVSFRILLVLLLLLIAGSFMVSNSTISYADDEKVSEEICKCQNIEELKVITIDNKGYKKDRKGPAKFEHVKHARDYKISCWECHHEYKDDQDTQETQVSQEAQVSKDIEITEGAENSKNNEENPNIYSPWGKTKKCIECHDPNEKKDDVIRLQAAYHKNCKECHVKERIFGDEYLTYRKCTKCHE